MPVSIYVLSDPRTPHDYRYLGRTAKDPAERLKGHLQGAMSRRPDGTWRNAVTHKIAWIRSLARDGYRPAVTVIAECDPSQLVLVEQQWIAALREVGHRLTNGTNGGEGNHLYKATGQTRRRQSEANLRRFENNPVEREFYRQLLLQRIGTPEGRKKLSAQATKQWADPAARAAQSERLRAALADPDLRSRRSAARRRYLAETEGGREFRHATSRRLRGEGNHSAKLDWEAVRKIRRTAADGSASRADLAQEHGVSRSLIDQIINCVIWTDDPNGLPVERPATYRSASPRLTIEFLKSVAQVYRTAVAGGQPSKAVACHFGVPTVKAYSWIATARRRGVLGPTKAGVPGEAA